jgi:hypothetical protein
MQRLARQRLSPIVIHNSRQILPQRLEPGSFFRRLRHDKIRSLTRTIREFYREYFCA